MKKIVVSILVLAVMLSMVACGTAAPATSEATADQSTAEPSAEASDATDVSKAPEGQATYSVGITISDLSNPTWAAQINEITAECEAMGWTVTAIQHDGDGAKAIQTIENFITAECDFIIIETGLEETVTDVLQEAKDAGICIIGDGTPLEIADINLMNDNSDAGYLCGVALGNWFNEKFGEDHEAIIAQMVYDYFIINDRTNGQLEGLASVHPNYKVVATGYPTDAATAMTETENILTAHPEIEAITNWGDSMALGTLETARSMGYTADNLAIVSIDGTPEVCAEIKAGSPLIATTSMGTPKGQGEFTVKILLAYIDGTYEDTYYLPNTLVDASNVDDYLE